MDIFEPRPIVFTAMSRHLFYCRMLVCQYVLERGAIPLNPFNLWDYFLCDLVERDLVRLGNNNALRISDETWVFGPVADGVVAEIDYAMKLGKPLRFYSAGPTREDFRPIDVADLLFEPDALTDRTADEVKRQLRRYLAGQS